MSKFQATVSGFSKVLVVFVATILTFFSSQSAFAVGALDQQATGSSTRWYYIMNNVNLGQVFKAGVSGSLDRVTLDMYSLSNPSAPAVVSLYAADGSGFPTGSALASASVSQSSIPGTTTAINFDFGTPASVTAGTSYVLVMSTTGSGEYHFLNATTVPAGAKGIKPSGATWVNYVDSGVTPNETSFRFATYVTPTASPSPSSSSTTPQLVNTGLDGSTAAKLLSLMFVLLLAGGVTMNLVAARKKPVETEK